MRCPHCGTQLQKDVIVKGEIYWCKTCNYKKKEIEK